MGWLARRRQKQAVEMLALIETAIGNRGKIVLDQMFRDQGIDPNNLKRSLKGDHGEQGAPGVTGPMGPAGMNGKDGYDYRQAVAAVAADPYDHQVGKKPAGPTAAEINAAKQSIMGTGVSKPKAVPEPPCGLYDSYADPERRFPCTKNRTHLNGCSWTEPGQPAGTYVAKKAPVRKKTAAQKVAELKQADDDMPYAEEPVYREDDEQPYCADGTKNPNWEGWQVEEAPARKRTPRKPAAKKVAS